MTAADLLARISSHELSEWQALYRIEAEEEAAAATAEQHAGQDAPDIVFTPSLF